MGFLIAAVLGIVTATTFFVVVFYLFLFGSPAKITRNADKYEETLAGNNYVHTAYIVFPEEIPESATDVEFYNYYRDTFNSPTVQTYLKCTYSPEDYEREIDRLENVHKTYGKRVETLKRDTEGKFNFPVYIAVENAASSYEYAMLTGENTIAYIYTSYIDSYKIKFDKNYLPDDFMTDENREFGSGYSIYYSSVSSMAIETDYTKDPVTLVSGAHMRYVGSDGKSVYVRYELDKESREIITGCDLYDADGNEEEFDLPEIVGLEYVSMTNDYDSDKLIIRCREDGEIREFGISILK